MISGGLTIQRLLASMKSLDASDLHIKVGLAPIYRIGGHLRRIDAPALSADECDHLLDPILSDTQKERFEQVGNLDFAWHLPDGDRFRIDIFKSGNHMHAAVRRVKAEIPSYADLHLPEIYSKIVETSPDGLVLVCGVTGSGKSSTIAAMVEQINQTEDVNIITIEDPIEYRFSPKMAIISQREVGIDVDSFKTALRFVVRQDPDVIFIGEMRDAETVLAAIQAAETGHLVFATLHTADTMQSLARMLEFFPPSERDFVRTSLANTLRAICAQKLIPALPDFGSKIVPACEVLLNNPVVREKIREGEDNDLPAIIAQSRADGMRSFTTSLAELVETEAIDLQTARGFAPNRDALDSMIKGVEVKAATLVHRIKGRS
ncbi:MAG: PilT/PilU family type 4a pilus ATPase [Phycisphaerales bacterium]|jgi:twitching motility protein PilT|nr:PilT/PilU family type 4a pilus ATPase [Phycisphaerales bacterium]